MAGGWQSALGAAILGGLGSYQDASRQQRIDKQQRFENERQLGNDRLQRQQFETSATTAALNQAILRQQLADAPGKAAGEDLKLMLALQGEDAYNNPEFVNKARTAGVPLTIADVNRPVISEIESGAGRPIDRNAIAVKGGYAPNTGVMLPDELIEKQRQRGAAANKQRIADDTTAKLLSSMPPGSPERLALEYEIATGKNAPAGLVKPTETWTTEKIPNKDMWGNESTSLVQVSNTGKMRKLGAGGPTSSDPVPSKSAGTAQTATPNSPLKAQVSGDAFLKTLPPNMQAMIPTIKKMAEYDFELPRGMARARMMPLLNAVAQYDPTFSESDYDNRRNLKKDYSSGATGKQVQALNAVVKHIATLKTKADALNNTQFPWLNEGTNFVQSNLLGDKRVKGYLTASNTVANELEKYFRGTGGSESGVTAFRKQIDASDSPEQIQEAFDTLVDLMTGQASSISNRWKQGMGRSQDYTVLSPESKTILDSVTRGHGQIADTAGPPVLMKAPSGETMTVPAKDVEHFKLKGAVVVGQ